MPITSHVGFMLTFDKTIRVELRKEAARQKKKCEMKQLDIFRRPTCFSYT